MPELEQEPLSQRELEGLHDEVTIAGVLPSWGGQYPPRVIPTSRDGFRVRDREGRDLLDLHQAILSMSVGWRNPEVEAAVQKDAQRYPGIEMVDTSQLYEPAVRLLQELHEALSPYGDYRGNLATSGTIANESAIRLCMGALGGPSRTQLIVAEGSYGGADTTMNRLCQVPSWKGDTSLPDVDLVVIQRDGSNLPYVLEAIGKGNEKLPLLHIEDGQQGVGGFYVYPKELLRSLAEAVHQTEDDSGKKGRVIVDDVQDFVRNGEGLFGFERWAEKGNPNHLPDAVTMAKGLGNGRAIAAYMVRQDVLQGVKDSGKPGAAFDTFAQQRDGIAAARTVLRLSREGRLWENVRERGERFKTFLRDSTNRHLNVATAVIGEGGLIGMQLKTEELAKRALAGAPNKGLLMAKGGLDNTVLRMPLPFTATDRFVDEAAQKVDDLLRSLGK